MRRWRLQHQSQPRASKSSPPPDAATAARGAFAGDAATGEPIDTVAAWAPQYTFPDPGTYTVVLNVGGLAGTGAAEATFAVKAGNNASTGGACSQVGGAGAGALLLSLGLLGIRRRQS